MPESRVRPVLVGLGGNLDGPARRIAAAAQRLATWPGVTGLRCSRLYRSPPWGRADQPDFVNAVAGFGYAGTPQGLLDGLLAIEREAGRLRTGEHWGPRRLDLDLLDFDGLVLDTPTLSLPHPRLAQRAFVLLPLVELAPDLRLADGRSARAHAERVDAAGVAALD
jgi:2-amino-4-hydroxy-6-hydroxymethyldihydropteridine diphosphokinase